MAIPIGPERFADRLAHAQAALKGGMAEALLVGVGPELEWLLGYPAHGHERLNLLVLPASGPMRFISPRLEAAAAGQSPGLASGRVELLTWEEGEDPYALVPGSLPGGDRGATRLLVSDGLRAGFLLRLQAVLPEARFGVASAVLAPLRRIKDADEVALLREAGAAADRVVAAILRGRLVGRSEADLAREVRERLVDEGHDSAEFAIVAAGPDSASPHHEPGGAVIEAGQPLLLDIGGRLGGYCSDITRTAWVGGAGDIPPDDEFVRIYDLVEQAQAAGRAAVRPGTSFEAIDGAARAVIEAGGFGSRFFHRLGHGLGLEVHEEPWVVSGNVEPAEAGNTFSVEPGIYLEGRYGVRIEDAVVCTTGGVDELNRAPRELLRVSGE